MCTCLMSHPYLVSLPFYTIPIFPLFLNSDFLFTCSGKENAGLLKKKKDYDYAKTLSSHGSGFLRAQLKVGMNRFDEFKRYVLKA